MKKFINNIKIFFVLAILVVLASCGNSSLSNNAYDDGKIYLSFNVNTNRSVYNPTSFTEDDVTAVRLYCKENGNDLTRYDKLNVGLLQEWLFVAKDGKNAIEVFTDSVIEFKSPMFTKKESSKGNDNYYDFIIELCTDDLKTTGKNQNRKDGGDVEASDYVYYTPIQFGSKEKVLVVPGLNTLSFTTENYRINGWTDYYSLIDFEYKSKKDDGVGYIEAVLKTYPYNDEQWFGIWDIIERKEVDPWFERRWGAEAKEGVVTLTSDNILFEDEHKTKFPYIETDRCNPNYVKNGEYTLELTLYDAKGRNVLRRTSDVIYLHGNKTKVTSKELSVSSGAVAIKYGVLSIDDPWNLCTNHGTITINDTLPLAQNETRTYSAQLKLGDEVIAESTGENAKLTVTGNTINWSSDLFAGKTATNKAYACKLVVNDKTFDLIVPDRKYYSYSVSGGDKLDPVAPGELSTVEGDIFIHFEGEGQEKENDTYHTVHDYASTLLSHMNERANVFIDLSDVSGINQILWGDVELAEDGAMLEGIAFPDLITKVEMNSFQCPKNDRPYKLTVVFGSAVNDVYSLVEANNEWLYGAYYHDENNNPVLNQNQRSFFNPFKKFIVSKNNSRLVTYQNGTLLADMSGNEHVELIASADVIEELELPFTINTIGSNAFAGNKMLKKIVEWGITSEIRNDAFNSSALDGNVELGVRVGFIGERAFANTTIESLTFSDAMAVFYDGIVPDDVYIGYKSGSNKVRKWAWVADPNVVKDGDIWCAYNGWDPSKTLPADPDGEVIILDWKEYDNYKYANYLGNANFKDHYFWRID
jgi:hypothetical protein